MAAQKDELQDLQRNLHDRDTTLSKYQTEKSTMDCENGLLKEKICEIKSTQKQLLQSINDKEEKIRRYKRNNQALKSENIEKTKRQEALTLELQELRIEKSNTVKLSKEFKSEAENLRERLASLQKTAKSPSIELLSKLKALKKAKKSYKQKVYHLQNYLEDLDREVSNKNQILFDAKRSFEAKLNTFKERERSLLQTNQDAKDRLEFISNKLNDLKQNEYELTQEKQALYNENNSLSTWFTLARSHDFVSICILLTHCFLLSSNDRDKTVFCREESDFLAKEAWGSITKSSLRFRTAL